MIYYSNFNSKTFNGSKPLLAKNFKLSSSPSFIFNLKNILIYMNYIFLIVYYIYFGEINFKKLCLLSFPRNKFMFGDFKNYITFTYDF